MSQTSSNILKSLHDTAIRIPADTELLRFKAQIILNVPHDDSLDALREGGISLSLLERNLERGLSMTAPAKIYVLFLYDDLVAIQMFALYLNWYAGNIATPGIFNNGRITIELLDKTVFSAGLIPKNVLHDYKLQLQKAKNYEIVSS